ncbi:hypothetical protein FHX37_0506 [Haloactinospora alba]|uniref:Uncharacterized protein n=1 Tax=Haloactinospora alba TaxID=405555 RepID=A0A543NFL0_9ACTN|nr:hypothetical protein FHX37_0506 [Haloactinospora alba]
MPTPEGATEVEYQFSTRDYPPYITSWTVVFEIGSGTSGEAMHTMAEVAADAMVNWLRSEYPDSDIDASRSYTGSIAGAPWPE